MRFVVLKFPSLRGSPWYFKSRTVAVIAAFIRSLFDCIEVRVIDQTTGEHIIIF